MDHPLAITVGARVNAYLTSTNDYHKYRQKLNKTLLKLRHDLDIVTRDTKNYKSKERISKISNDEYNKDNRFGLLLLLTAERDLVHSLEIKSLLEISNEKTASYKNLMISKLKKSVNGVKKLLEVVNNESDDFKMIELYTYQTLNEGSLALNKRKWETALNCFSIAKCALDFLYNYEDENKMKIDDDTQQDQQEFNKTVINELITTIVDPSLNLSTSQLDINFNSSDLKTISRKYCHEKTLPYLQKLVQLVEKYDSSYVSEISSSIQLITSIKWRNHEASLYNDEIAFKIMSLTSAETNKSTDINQFDQLISEWTQTLDLHNGDLEKNQDEDDMEKVQDRAVLLTFINYNLLFTKIRRDSLLVEQLLNEFDLTSSKTKKLNINKDLTRLYSSITDTIGELKELPGVFNDEDLVESLENMQKYFQAQQLIRLSNSFGLNEKFPQALKVLYHIKTQVLGETKDKFYLVEDFPYSITNNQQYDQFMSQLNQEVSKAHVLAQFSFETASKTTPNEYVIENLNKYPTTDSIINLGSTPKLAPVMPKPVLFDVGFNYINYNDNSSSTPEPQTNADDSKKRGLFGLFGR